MPDARLFFQSQVVDFTGIAFEFDPEEVIKLSVALQHGELGSSDEQELVWRYGDLQNAVRLLRQELRAQIGTSNAS